MVRTSGKVLSKAIFILVFALLAFLGMRANFSSILGSSNQSFTFFQFFGPVAGGFLGIPLGAVAVFGAQIVDAAMTGKSFDMLMIVRLLPMVFAAYYFGFVKREGGMQRDYMGIIVPLVCMALFVAHPVARESWYYSLYWLIPVIVRLLPDSVHGKLFLRSLGSTFTAHAVGSTIFLYTIPTTAALWTSLIPVVAYERLLFASGIAVSYLVIRAALKWIAARLPVTVPGPAFRHGA